MGRIKCLKLKCKCGREGLAQVFLRKDGSISYARVRHYSHIDKDSKKPQFTYCKITDLGALKTLLLKQDISLSIDRAEMGQMGQGQTDKNHDLENSNSSLNQQNMRCRGSLAWLGRQTHNLENIKGGQTPDVQKSRARS
jgi:hypothetical protein